MNKAKLTVLGVEIEIEAKDQKQLWQDIAFYQTLPTTCPIDNTPTRFGFKSPSGNDYYTVTNTNPDFFFEFHVGQTKDGSKLFAEGTWKWWDWKNKEEVVLGKWNTLTEEGQHMQARILGRSVNAEVTHRNTPAQEPRTAAKSPSWTTLLNAAGEARYGADWTIKRERSVKALAKQDNKNYTGVGDLSEASLKKWVHAIEKDLRTEAEEIASYIYDDEDALADLIGEVTGDDPRPIDEVHGPYLIAVIKELRNLQTA